MATFIGFTTSGQKTGSTTLEDRSLAKTDLSNHFYTRRGERLGEPEFGSILPELVFEPFTDATIDAADNDVIDIIAADPRWQLVSHQVDSTIEHQITITIQLIYVTDTSAVELVLKYRTTENF